MFPFLATEDKKIKTENEKLGIVLIGESSIAFDEKNLSISSYTDDERKIGEDLGNVPVG